MKGLAEAQRIYGNRLPTEEKEVTKLPFNFYDVGAFIHELSMCDSPVKMLEDYGYAYDTSTAEMMRSIAKSWARDELKTHSVVGNKFYAIMKDCALSRYNEE